MPDSNNFSPNDAYDKTATVANGASTSEGIDLSGTDLVGVFVPAEFDGTTIGLTASTAIDGTFVTVQDGEGSTLSITCAASRFVPIKNFALIAGLRFIKITTGTAQTGATVFTLALRPL